MLHYNFYKTVKNNKNKEICEKIKARKIAFSLKESFSQFVTNSIIKGGTFTFLSTLKKKKKKKKKVTAAAAIALTA